jgi:hypothetical protein
MDRENPVLKEFSGYWKLSERLASQASKEDLIEVAQILALQAALYARTYGELPIPDMDHLLSNIESDDESLELLRDGAKAFVGVLAMTGDGFLDKEDDSFH